MTALETAIRTAIDAGVDPDWIIATVNRILDETDEPDGLSPLFDEEKYAEERNSE